MRSPVRQLALATATTLAYAGRGSASTDHPSATTTTATGQSLANRIPSGGMTMQHSMNGVPAPAGMKIATQAKYPVGAKVTLKADYMPAMKGAPASLVGAHSTVTYAVT